MDQNHLQETPEQEAVTFTVVNNEGKEVQCEILFSFQSDTNGKDYIVYTDHSLDENGNYKVFASVYKPDSDDSTLYPIEIDEEWDQIEALLLKLQGRCQETDDWEITMVD